MTELTSSQKAIAALEIEERLAIEARGRRLAGLKQNGAGKSLRKEFDSGQIAPLSNHLDSGQIAPLSNSFLKERAVKQAAAEVGVNQQYVTYAKKIKRQAPELLDPIRDGLLTIPQAKKIADMPIRQRVLVVAQIKSGLAKNVAQAIHQIPEKERAREEDMPERFGSGWTKAMYKLWVFFNSLKDHGGIAKLSRKWHRDVKRDYLVQLRQVQGAINECIKYLEKEFR